MRRLWVAPFVGAWIEISFLRHVIYPVNVAPFVGAWIEIIRRFHGFEDNASLRSSERGLKCLSDNAGKIAWLVAPFVGAWIEIIYLAFSRLPEQVAPFVGAWIEICIFYTFYTIYTVAPFVGAWIEIGVDRHR